MLFLCPKIRFCSSTVERWLVKPRVVGSNPARIAINFVAQQVGGKGGGKADMAMAGGTDASKLPDALKSVHGWVTERV